MRVSFNGGELRGSVSPPSSKSHTHRAFFLAAMANGRSEITNALLSNDTRATLRASEAMGAKVSFKNESVVIDGGILHPPKNAVDADNSGTTLRIFAGLASMFNQTVTITGDPSLQKRPIQPLLDSLSQTGTHCTSDNGMLPITVTGPNVGGNVTVNSGISSQFVTSLMMVSPMLPEDSHIRMDGATVSEPYLNVTSSLMKLFGADIRRTGDTFNITGRTGYQPHDYHVPSDFSSAAFLLVAGALGGKVSINGLNLNDLQGDRRIIDILQKVGSSVEISNDTVTAERSVLKPIDLDLGNTPDLFPIVAVLLSTANGTSRLYGAPQLRFKESDRIESTVSMLESIGADISGIDDGCIINGKPELSGGMIDNKGDHRIMMAAAIASLVCKEAVTMENGECCSVSYPKFIDDMRSIGMRIEG